MKINLVLLILIVFFVILLNGNDLEEKKIMPKKLYYNELPDDYPKELEELFRFFYDFGKQLSKSVDNDDEVTKYISCYYDTLSIETAYSFCYLHWLAKSTIPLYYCEFRDIFLWESSSPDHRLTFDDISYLDEMFSNTKLQGWYASPTNIIKAMINKVNDFKQELSVVNMFDDDLWIRGRITNSEVIVNNFTEEKYNFIFKTIDVQDDFCNEFIYDEINAFSTISSNQSKFGKKLVEIGKEYLIPLDIYELNHSLSYRDKTNEIGEYLFGINLEVCFLIENGYVKNQFESKNFYSLLVFGENIDWTEYSEEHKFYDGFGDQSKYKTVNEISYREFRVKIIDSIDFLKMIYERRGL